MDQEQIRKLIIESTKSLTVHDVEVVETKGLSVHFRIIAEAYASQGKAQRVLTVLDLIKKNNAGFSEQFFFTVDPFTPEEFRQFYDTAGSPQNGQPQSGDGEAARPAEV